MLHIASAELWNPGERTSDDELGMLALFDAYDPATRAYLTSPSHKIVAQLVKNRHSSALTPGQIVLVNTDAEGPGRAVEGPAGAGNIATGVVPWCIPSAGVAVGALFWLIKQGPCKFLSDGGNDVAAGALVITGATGYVSAHTLGTDDAAVVGRMIEAIGSSAGALKKGLAAFPY